MLEGGQESSKMRRTPWKNVCHKRQSPCLRRNSTTNEDDTFPAKTLTQKRTKYPFTRTVPLNLKFISSKEKSTASFNSVSVTRSITSLAEYAFIEMDVFARGYGAEGTLGGKFPAVTMKEDFSAKGQFRNTVSSKSTEEIW